MVSAAPAVSMGLVTQSASEANGRNSIYPLSTSSYQPYTCDSPIRRSISVTACHRRMRHPLQYQDCRNDLDAMPRYWGPKAGKGEESQQNAGNGPGHEVRGGSGRYFHVLDAALFVFWCYDGNEADLVLADLAVRGSGNSVKF